MAQTSTTSSNGGDSNTATDAVLLQLEPSDDDEFYMQRMADILDAFPKSGPPKHPVRLSDHLYIGNQDNADDLDLLPALGITHVLNMAGTRNFDPTRSPYKPNVGVKAFLMIQAEDYDEYDIIQYFVDAIAFLGRAKSTGGQALVHCNYGVNRSGAVAAAYLMVSERKPLLEVVQLLKAKRSLILSNVGFRRQLIRFARCRGFLDAVERKRSLRSSGSGARLDRLDLGEDVRSASHSRAVTPVKMNGGGTENGLKEIQETKLESSGNSSNDADDEIRAKYMKATALYGKAANETKNGYHNGYHNNGYHNNGYQNGYRNGYHNKVDNDQNGDIYMTAVTTMNGYNHRERLLRDIDDVIANISQKNNLAQKINGFSSSNGYHDDILKPVSIARDFESSSEKEFGTSSSSKYMPTSFEDKGDSEITSSTAYLTPSVPAVDITHSVDDYYPTTSATSFDREYSVSSLDSSSSYFPSTSRIFEPQSSGILDEYYEYKNAAGRTSSLPPRPVSAALVSANEFVSNVKPRSHYYRPTVAATKSSVMDDYDEADIRSYLAQSDARRASAASAAAASSRSGLSPGSRRNVSVPSFDDVVAQTLRSARRFSTPGSFSSALQSLYQPAYPTSSTASARSYSSSSHQSHVGKSAAASAGRSLPPSGLSAASTRRSLSSQRPQSGYSYGSTSTRYAGELYNGDSSLSGDSAFSTGQAVRTRVTVAPGLAGPRPSYAILQDFDW